MTWLLGLPPGRYETAAGSHVEIFGAYGGAFRVSFDWVEEAGACCDCEVAGIEDGALVWRCEGCGGGKARLRPRNDPMETKEGLG